MFTSLMIGLAIVLVSAVIAGWMLFGNRDALGSEASDSTSTLTANPAIAFAPPLHAHRAGAAVATAVAPVAAPAMAPAARVATSQPSLVAAPVVSAPQRGTTASERAAIRSAVGLRGQRRSGSVGVRWYERIRAGVLLALITVGVGMAVGALFGLVALLLSFVIG